MFEDILKNQEEFRHKVFLLDERNRLFVLKFMNPPYVISHLNKIIKYLKESYDILAVGRSDEWSVEFNKYRTIVSFRSDSKEEIHIDLWKVR